MKKLIISAGIVVAAAMLIGRYLRKIEVKVTHENEDPVESGSDRTAGRSVGIGLGIQSDLGLRLLSRVKDLPDQLKQQIDDLISDPESWVSRGRPERKPDETV